MRATNEPTRNISVVNTQLDAAPCAVPDNACPLVHPSAMRAPYISSAPPAALATGERTVAHSHGVVLRRRHGFRPLPSASHPALCPQPTTTPSQTSARARGLAVTMVDDGGLDLISGPELRAIRQQLAAAIAQADSGRLIIRTSRRAETAVSVVGRSGASDSDDDDVSLWVEIARPGYEPPAG